MSESRYRTIIKSVKSQQAKNGKVLEVVRLFPEGTDWIIKMWETAKLVNLLT